MKTALSSFVAVLSNTTTTTTSPSFYLLNKLRMANQQQPRPAWFRLSSLAGRAPAPTPARPAVPVPAATRPPPAASSPPAPKISPPASFLPSSGPSPATRSPLQKSPVQRETLKSVIDAVSSPTFQTQSSSPNPTSSVPKPAGSSAAATTTAPINGNGKTAMSSSKIVKPLEVKLSSNPNSPPALITTDGHQKEPKIDQKSVLVQHTPRAHNSSVPSNGKRESSVLKDKGTSKKVHDPEELGMRVITLAGENKGAVMELSPSREKSNNTTGNGIPHSLHKKQGTSSEDQPANNKAKMQSPMLASLNSNVQGLNNSILYKCSFKSNDPGIHLSLDRKGNGSYSSDVEK